jgi:hypothetical protein
MITGASGRTYDPLPIDNAAGFPQRFPLLLNGVRYEFSLYANVPEPLLGPSPTLTTIGPTPAANATLRFAAVPETILPGMLIADVTAGAVIATGTAVVSTTTTTVVMSQNATGAGVGSGDKIEFNNELMALPDGQRFLVVRVDALGADGTQQTIFLRKVVPSLEYRAGGLMLTFPTQIVARRNLNNPGNLGSNVIGGVTSL